MINRSVLHQGDWMGHPLQSLMAILKHPSWRPQGNRMATYILTEAQDPSAAQHFQWAIQPCLRKFPKLNDWEAGPTTLKCPCFSLKKSCQPSPVLHLGFPQRLLCKRNPRSPHRWHSDLEISIWKIFLERQITVTGSDKEIFFFILPLKTKRGKAIVCLLRLHRDFCNPPQHAKGGKSVYSSAYYYLYHVKKCVCMCSRERLLNLVSTVAVHLIYFVVRIFAASTMSSIFASEEINFSVFLNDKLILLTTTLSFAADNSLSANCALQK